MKRIILSAFLIVALLVPQISSAKTNPAVYELNEIAVKLYEISRDLNKNNRYIYEKDAADMEEARAVAILMGHIRNSAAMCYMQHLMIFNVSAMNENTKAAVSYSESSIKDAISRIKETRTSIVSETVVLILDQTVDKLEAALELLGKCSKIIS